MCRPCAAAAAAYRGAPDPLHGDAKNKEVRDMAQEVMAAVFETGNTASEAMQGVDKLSPLHSVEAKVLDEPVHVFLVFPQQPKVRQRLNALPAQPGSEGHEGGIDGSEPRSHLVGLSFALLDHDRHGCHGTLLPAGPLRL